MYPLVELNFKGGKPLLVGITIIANDENYDGFIFDVYGTDEDGDELCIDGGGNEEEIDNLRDVEVKFNDHIVTINRAKGDEFLSQLCDE
uniref:Uncharacterized protein n=1 Tax=Lactuca sativa TaxID=4236 RepID=A0A9R1V8S0_LACSA|nr:hypothetical protein LSAT_V11C600328750 [Lactuca sativa]